MRILVTGGAGFLGSHLSSRLLTEGHEVVCMDDFSTGSRRNIAQLMDRSGFTVVEHDVTEPYDDNVDFIVNMACPASPVHYQRDPVKTTLTSVLGAKNALDLARRRDIPVFQASTSEVYGDPEVHPQVETYWGHVNPIGPRACYDEGKRVAETLFFDYLRTYGTDIRVARFFNTYGPNMSRDDGRVVSNFIVQALASNDLTIYGTGTQTRSFCYVDDLIDGIMGMLSGKPSRIGPYNLGNPTEFTVRELADLVIELTGSSSRIVEMPLPMDDPRQRKPDIARATRELEWKPSVQLRDGLQRTIAYFASLAEIEATTDTRKPASQAGQVHLEYSV